MNNDKIPSEDYNLIIDKLVDEIKIDLKILSDYIDIDSTKPLFISIPKLIKLTILLKENPDTDIIKLLEKYEDNDNDFIYTNKYNYNDKYTVYRNNIYNTLKFKKNIRKLFSPVCFATVVNKIKIINDKKRLYSFIKFKKNIITPSPIIIDNIPLSL